MVQFIMKILAHGIVLLKHKQYLGQAVLPEHFWLKVDKNLAYKAEIQDPLQSHIHGVSCCMVWKKLLLGSQNRAGWKEQLYYLAIHTT